MALPQAERIVFNYGHPPGHTVAGRPEAETPSPRYTEVATWRSWRSVDRGYLGLLAFTIVLLTRPQDTIPGLSALHFAELAAILGVLPMVVNRLTRGLPLFRLTPDMLAMCAFGLIILATAPFSIWPGGAVGVFTDFYSKILIVFILMMNTLTTPKRLEQISWVILLCTGYVAARAVLDYARGINLVEGGRIAGSVGGMFGNPNDLAMNLVSFIPAGIVIAMSPRHSLRHRLIAGATVLCMLAATVFTKSRGGFLGLATAILVLALLGHHIRRGFGTLVVVATLVALPLMPSSFWGRMSSIFDEKVDRYEFTGSRESRRIVMEEGIATFLEHPLTGVGAGQFKNYNPPTRRERWRETHNAPLQVAAETGIVGLLLFVFLIWRGIRAGSVTRGWLRRFRPRSGMPLVLADADRALLYEQSIAASAGLAGWLVCAMFASVAYNWTFYFLFALAVSARVLTTTRLSEARAWMRAHTEGRV